MRLNELQSVGDIRGLQQTIMKGKSEEERNNRYAHKLSRNSREYLNMIMERLGFELTGTGWYSKVYVKEGYPYVLKVFAENQSYLEWIAFCNTNRNNPYLPKFRGLPIHIAGNHYAIRMEILQFKGAVIQDNISDMLERMVLRINSLYPKEPRNEDQILDYIDKHTWGGSGTSEYLFDHYNDPNLELVIKKIASMKDNGYRMDLTHSNIMFRDNQLVITDPIADPLD